MDMTRNQQFHDYIKMQQEVSDMTVQQFHEEKRSKVKLAQQLKTMESHETAQRMKSELEQLVREEQEIEERIQLRRETREKALDSIPFKYTTRHTE